MTADDTLARHRYATVSCTIPDRLDQVADQLDDILKLMARYGLAEALQPDPAHDQLIARDLQPAAARIQTAADQVPTRGTRKSHPPINPSEAAPARGSDGTARFPSSPDAAG